MFKNNWKLKKMKNSLGTNKKEKLRFKRQMKELKQ